MAALYKYNRDACLEKYRSSACEHCINYKSKLGESAYVLHTMRSDPQDGEGYTVSMLECQVCDHRVGTKVKFGDDEKKIFELSDSLPLDKIARVLQDFNHIRKR